MRPFAYHQPETLAEALSLAQVSAESHVGAAVQFVGGGTTIVDLMKLQVMLPTALVDITGLRDPVLHSISRNADGLRIGSLVSMARLSDDDMIRRDYPVLRDSLWQAASQQLRNMALLGGNVLQRTRCSYFRDTSYAQCNKRLPGSGCAAIDGGVDRGHAVLGTSRHCIATYPSDWAQALIALDARVETLAASGARSIAFADLHRLPGAAPQIETTLKPGELVTGFVVPGDAWPKSLYRKIRDRESYQFANASAAVALRMDGDRIADVGIGLGGVATVPWRARRAEAALCGSVPSEEIVRHAAALEFEQATPLRLNAFKVPLGQATLTRAVLDAIAMEA